MLLLVLAPVALLASGPLEERRRPAVDLVAMREAMGAREAVGQFPSAATYAHFLKARLAHEGGDQKEALDELRLALATDEASPYLKTALAWEYAHQGDLKRAEVQLAEVLQRAPDDVRARRLMGQVLLEAKKPKRARAHLERAIRLAPTAPEAYLVLAELLMEASLPDEAVKVIERLGKALPGESVGYRRLGLALAARGDGVRSERLLRKSVERDQGDLEAWSTLAHIYESTFRLAKALEAWERAAERDPENPDILLSSGRVALRLGRLEEGRAWLERLLALDGSPKTAVKVAFTYLAGNQPERAAEVLETVRAPEREPRLQFYAGLVNERLRRFEAALAAFEQVSEANAELYPEAQLHLAMCLSSLGRHDAALEVLGRLAAERPAWPGLDVTLARALELSGQVSRAEAELVQAFERGPSPELAEALTGFYQRQGRLPEAVRIFKSAAGRRPADESLRFALAVALEKVGDWRGAVAALEQRTDHSPAAANFVGYALADHGQDLDRALRLVQRALESGPDNGTFLDSMGWVWFKRGDARRALGFLERALVSSPDEPTLLEHLGEVLLRHGRRAEARDCFRRAVERLAHTPDAAERPGQGAQLERKLKLLSQGAASR